jgi:hypothetical protein
MAEAANEAIEAESFNVVADTMGPLQRAKERFN